MISIQVHSEQFTQALQKYAALTGKGMSEVVKEQAKLLAKRLQDLTYPFNASQGKKRVAIDIGKVYLRNEWFEDTFRFTNKNLGERVVNMVRAKDTAALEEIFRHSSSLQKLHIEAFEKARHAQAQKAGRVSYKQPYSFPLAEQSRVKALIDEKKKKVGFAKSGWASCYSKLGGSAPGWLKQATGSVDDHSDRQDMPSVTLTNDVSYFAAIDAKANVVSRALEGRASTMLAAAKNAIERALR